MSNLFSWQKQELLINIYVQPNASHTEIVGTYDDKLKIKIKAPAIEGKANKELIDFLAEYFGVSKRNVVISKGSNGRSKKIIINKPQKNLTLFKQ